MLVLHKDYNFSAKDIGKKALLANYQTVKIITVIREAGQLHSVYGVSQGFTDLMVWDGNGKAELEELNIVMLFDEEQNEAARKK